MTVPKVILYNKTSVIYIGNVNPFRHAINENESLGSNIHFMTQIFLFIPTPSMTSVLMLKGIAWFHLMNPNYSSSKAPLQLGVSPSSS